MELHRMMICFTFVIVFLKHVNAVSFQPVTSTCKYWDPVSILGNNERIKLHCILDDNYQLGIVNTSWKLMEKGKCPYYNRHTEQIGTFDCVEGDRSCPQSSYRSYQATQFSGCMKENKNFIHQGDNTRTSGDSQPIHQITWLPIMNTILLLVILVFNVTFVSCVAYFEFCRGKRTRTQAKNGKKGNACTVSRNRITYEEKKLQYNAVSS